VSRKPTRKKSKAPAPKAPPRRGRKRAARFSLRHWILPALGLAAVTWGAVWFIGTVTGEQQQALHGAISKRRATARAKVIERARRRKGMSVHYHFEYKGILYENWQSDYDDVFRLRACYAVAFDSSNPVRSFLLEGTEGDCPVH
jgi:hypothetical protein